MARNNELTRSSGTLPSQQSRRSISPWDDLASMHRQMDEFFSRAFGFTPLSRLLPTETLEVPDLEIYEKGDTVFMEAALPGFTAQDITVQAREDGVILQGERRIDESDDTRYHQRSRWAGFTKFLVTVPLPAEVDPSKVDAKLENGILKLQLQKSERARQKSVQVNVKSQ